MSKPRLVNPRRTTSRRIDWSNLFLFLVLGGGLSLFMGLFSAFILFHPTQSLLVMMIGFMATFLAVFVLIILIVRDNKSVSFYKTRLNGC